MHLAFKGPKRKCFVSMGKMGYFACNMFVFMALRRKWGRGVGALLPITPPGLL
jgi:hypothetical protein